MAKVDGSLKTLIQGVSQQPSRTRLPGQCTAQDNMSSNPVEGLTRRPPLDYIANLFSVVENPQFYDCNMGADKQFIIAALTTGIRVFDHTGAEKTVTEVDDGFDYLTGEPLAFTTIENKTFLANRSKVVTMESEFAEFRDYGCIVYILGGQYAREYTITVNWLTTPAPGTPKTVTVTHTTPDGSVSAHGAQIATDYIAEQLETLLNAATGDSFNTTFTVSRVNEVLYITWDDARTDTFEITVGDGMGGNNIYAVNNKVRTVGQLPKFAPHGYHVKVTGDGQASQDDWYLEFSVTPDSEGNTPAVGTGFGKAGIWVETVQTRIEYLLDVTTMPHVLEYDPDTDEFTFGPGDWAGRQVGDEETNENPSFVGRTIEWLSYFQGRLVALSGPAVIMSRTNKPFDFWIETATGQTDTDAIDIESTAKGVSKMLKAIPHNRDLVVFAEGAQFIVFGRNTLTPQNSSLVLTTAFEANLNATPVAAGRNIFFGIDYGNFTGIREFYTDGAQDVNDSRPITQHVLRYIEGGVTHMASTSNFDALLVQAGNESILYSYEYIWLGQEKAQSAWSRWLMPNPVRFFFFFGSNIYVISKVETNFVLERMNLDIQNDFDLTYQVKLDRKRSVAGVNTTIVNFLPQMPDIDDMIFIQGTGCPNPGLRVLVDSYDAGTNTITLAEDMLGGTVIGGQKYRSAYKPTMPLVRDQDGVKVGTGKLVISKFYINCKHTGILEATITSKYKAPATIRFTGMSVGNPDALVGEAVVVDVTYTVPFRENADIAEIELHTDSHLPWTALDIEWIGQYTKRGKRITQGA